jgi:thiol-disulfide isomerase/thioredoxin
MKTSIALHLNALKSILSAAVVALGLTFGIQTTRAQVATNFAIVNHATGQPLSLANYQGSIILLDFWAYWCEYCQAAASDIEPNITQYYRNAGGNSNGVPVQVISVNIDCSDPPLEDSYITTYGLELVADDCDEVAFSQFDFGGIPQFAVINGTTNSVNYTPWQIVSEPTGYATNYTVPLLESYIDSIQTPAPISTVTNPVNGAVIAPPNVTLAASVATDGMNIKQVEFYNRATLLGSITNMPCSLTWSNGGFWAVGGQQATNMLCSLTWSNVPVGAKSVFARAYYGASSSVDSAAVNFTVGNPLVVKLSTQNTNFLLSWTGGAGNFQVQVATNLAGAVWQNYGTAGTNTSQVITPTNQAAFYRVMWP